jgi:hypothetical protein
MPSIPVGTQTAAYAKRRVEFACKRCGHHALADVTGMGEGMQSFLNSDGTAERRAREDAVKDIDRTIARARCPKCKQRSPGALFRFLRPYLIMAACFLALGIVAGYAPTWFDMNMGESDRAICKWVMPLVLGGTVLLVAPLPIWIKWSTTDSRVKWVND